MKKLTIIKSLCSASVLAAALFGQTAFAAEKVTFEEFAKMGYEARLQVCAEHVDSEDIARCAALKSKPSAMAIASDSAKQDALIQCAKEENTTTPQSLTSCVQKKLSGPSMGTSYTDAQFHTALKMCAKDKSLTSTNAVLQCTYKQLKK